MTVMRVMGTETEYGVSVAGQQRYNPVQLSFDVVKAAAGEFSNTIRWDYRQEDPVRDARGFSMDRAAARPEMLTDEPQLHIVNVVAPNGGRIYVDHAHPEYSAPETVSPFTALAYDHAGDVLMEQAARNASAATGMTVRLYRNNVDGKGASWGSHENYMVRRDVSFDQIASLMTTHFVTRQIYTGSGRVGIGEGSEQQGFQLSQRADYFHAELGLQTTFDRPIINTRDESHSTDEFRRLHVIAGDANRMDVPQVLKLGTTSLLLWALEASAQLGVDLADTLAELQLADPVAAMHTVSHDLSLAAPLAMADGSTSTAWQIQVSLYSLIYAVAAMVYDTDIHGEPLWPDKETVSVLALWKQVLMDVATVRQADDSERLVMEDEARRLEWLFKWQLIEKLVRRSDASLSFEEVMASPRAKAIDLQWAALAPEESLFAKVQSHTERCVSQSDIETAMVTPPENTRAWLRAEMIKRWGSDVAAVSWSHIAVRNLEQPGEFVELDMKNPLAWTKEETEAVLDNAANAAQALNQLSSH